MKNIFLSIVLLLQVIVSHAQAKPQKTFKHDKFANKVYGQFSAGMNPAVFLPDDKALQYISSKSGRSMDDLKKERENNRTYIDNDKAVLSTKNVGGLMVTNVELKPKEHATLVMADIIIVLAGGKRIELGNCIQTDITWVLGDYMGMEGEKPVREKIRTKQDEIDEIKSMQEKNYEALNNRSWEVFAVVIINSKAPDGHLARGGKLTSNPLYWFAVDIDGSGHTKGVMFKGQESQREMGDHYTLNKETNKLTFYAGDTLTYDFLIQGINEKKMVLKRKMEDDEYYFVAYVNEEKTTTQVDTSAVVVPAAPKQKYKATYSTNSSDPADAYMKRDLFDKPVRGYYIDKSGNKIEAVIKYQAPHTMQASTSTLLIYNIAYNEPGFTEDESTNFKTMIMKSEIKAFYVAGYLYVPVGNDWNILLTEGAIRESVWIGSGKKEGSSTVVYLANQMIHRHTGPVLAVSTMGISFKNQMSDLVKDYPELATKIKNKEDGYKYLQYQRIISEYNTWYDANNPGKTDYFYKE